MRRSRDDGLSWSTAEKIAWSRQPDWSWLAAGPPAALVTRTGRWMVPCDGFLGADAFYSATEVFSFVLYSDDRGVTWHQGPLLQGGNECQTAELADGSLLLNMRSRDARRLFSRSEDDGASWSPPESTTPPLVDGNCQGSMVALHDGRTLLATSVGIGRTTLYARVSHDGGRKWETKVVTPDPSGYSSLVPLDGLTPSADDAATHSDAATSDVALLFETKPPPRGRSSPAAARHNQPEQLVFGRLTVAPAASGGQIELRDEL